MHLGVYSLLVSLAALQIFQHVVEAQPSVEALAGISAAQATAGFNQIGQTSPYFPSAGVPQLQGVGGYPSYPAMYPSYPVEYYRSPGIIASCFRFIKYLIIKVITLPLRVIRFVKNVFFGILGLPTDFDYSYGNYQYPPAGGLF